MQGIYTEKEILGDALATQKSTTAEFNTAANECVHEDVRKTMLHILSQEHEIQQDVFNMMHTKGFYPTPMAEEKKVQETKQQFCQCAK
ncbi:MAG: spore coat protein [Lachnospiraceae bacterium]|nr:spore coat protein [Lachnospiraceae bacterium]